MDSSEHAEQCAFMDFVRTLKYRYPELGLLFSIPNGAKLPFKKVQLKSGKMGRYSPQAEWLIREGLRPGVSDVMLPVARGGFHGLFIEMKYGKNKPTDEQKEFILSVRDQGYRADVCYGADEAIAVLCEYMEINDAI